VRWVIEVEDSDQNRIGAPVGQPSLEVAALKEKNNLNLN
jgi:hypothetical protein